VRVAEERTAAVPIDRNCLPAVLVCGRADEPIYIMLLIR